MGISPWPVITITGTSVPLSLRRRRSSIPVISGIRTSVMTHPSERLLMLSRNAEEVSYQRASIFALRSKKDNESRAASSSSMTCTTGLSCIADLLVAHSSERKVEHCPSTRVGFGPDLPAVRFDYGSTNRKAYTHAMQLGRDKRLKQLRSYLGRYP